MLVKLMRRHHDVDVLSLTAWSTLFGSVPLILVASFHEARLPVWSGDFSLVVGLRRCWWPPASRSFLWLFVLKNMPASVAGLGTMATPVMGLLFSWAQLGEQPTVIEGIGMVAILAGSAILFLRGLREAPAAPGAGAAGRFAQAGARGAEPEDAGSVAATAAPPSEPVGFGLKASRPEQRHARDSGRSEES